MRKVLTGLALLCFTSSALATRASLPSLTSEVYQTEGDHVAITRRANTCAAQLLHSGLQTIPVIISSDPEAGSVVARNTFRFPINSAKGVFAVFDDARSQVTVQAKDGRFRILYSDIEMLVVDQWQPIDGAQTMIGNATETLNGISSSLAGCIQKGGGDNW